MKLLDDDEDTELIVARDIESLVAYREAWLKAAKELAKLVESISSLEWELGQKRRKMKKILVGVAEMGKGKVMRDER